MVLVGAWCGRGVGVVWSGVKVYREYRVWWVGGRGGVCIVQWGGVCIVHWVESNDCGCSVI